MMLSVKAETEEQQRTRFQVELEFVQCLANPSYLNFLAQRGYLKDQSFINYLKYLLYWKEDEYSNFMKYPSCLYFLELLQHEHFRAELVKSSCIKFVDEQHMLMWQHYSQKRNRLTSLVDHSMESSSGMPSQDSKSSNSTPCLPP